MSQRRDSDDGPQPSGDGELPELPSEWSHFVIPDDPRELATEAEQVRAELALEQGGGWRRPARRGWFRYGLSGPLMALVLMVIASVASLVIVATPTGRQTPAAAPLAQPTPVVGSIGGLVPDLVLRDADRQEVALRQVRPAVLLLIPRGCACGELAADLVLASRESMVTVGLVGIEEAPALPPGSLAGLTRSLVDPDGSLTAAINGARAIGPVAAPTELATAVLVRADGVIARIVRDLRTPRELQNDLAALLIR